MKTAMKNVTPFKYDPMCGTHISTACKEACRIASEKDRPVEFKFNDITLTAMPGNIPVELEVQWNTESEKRRIEYERSAEYKAYLSERETETEIHSKSMAGILEEFKKFPEKCTGCLDWLKRYADTADNVGVNSEIKFVLETYKEHGYTVGFGVGESGEFFDVADNYRRYIIGQVMDFLEQGYTPHPVTSSFIDKFYKQFPKNLELN